MAMKTFGLKGCLRFDGFSRAPLCAVQPLLGGRCRPCHRSANKASACLSRERRKERNVILSQQNERLHSELSRLRNEDMALDAENAAFEVAIYAKKQKKAELLRRHNIRQQQGGRCG